MLLLFFSFVAQKWAKFDKETFLTNSLFLIFFYLLVNFMLARKLLHNVKTLLEIKKKTGKNDKVPINN